MAYEIELPPYAAIPAIPALAGAAFIMKPEELRRDPVLEAQGLVGMAAKYEVMYARCDDGTDDANGGASFDAAGLAKGFAGGFSHRFPARSDEDAASFVVKARPQCDVASLYRLDRHLVGSSAGRRYSRVRIEV